MKKKVKITGKKPPKTLWVNVYYNSDRDPFIHIKKKDAKLCRSPFYYVGTFKYVLEKLKKGADEKEK